MILMYSMTFSRYSFYFEILFCLHVKIHNSYKFFFIYVLTTQAKLEKEIANFGSDKMKIEEQKLANVNKDIEEKCQVKYLPKDELPKEKQLYGGGILGYEILGIEKYPQCKWMAIDEPKFIDYLRLSQNQKLYEDAYET